MTLHHDLLGNPRVLRRPEHGARVELKGCCISDLSRDRIAFLSTFLGPEAVEKSLLRDGFEHPEIVDYGVMGIAIGCASWSAVAYHALAPARALDEAAHVDVQLRTQAMWCYSRSILDQVEDGQDPAVPEGFGWRYLRAMRSKAVSPGAQESIQSLSMRRAIFATSHLDDQLASAIECLK